MRRVAWAVVGLSGLVAACDEAEEHTFSPYGGGRRDAVANGPPGPDLRFVRPPARDAGPDADVGPDAARVEDRPDRAQPPPKDAAVDAVVDAAPPPCTAGSCGAVVELSRCEPCPVAAQRTGEAPRCVVPYDPATPLFEYVPFDCTADCPIDTPQVCNSFVGSPVCDADGRCRLR